MLEVKQVSYFVKEKQLLNHISVSIPEGDFLVIMGANGAGKSTLLKIMSGLLKPHSGEITWNGKNISTIPKPELARERAVLSQHYHIHFPVSAYEVVMMGRYPYFTNAPAQADKVIAEEAMKRMQVWHLAERDYNTLSGGEAQKIQMCRVLAQIENQEPGKPRILLLDEPVSHLDIKYQHQLLAEAQTLTKHGVTIVAVLHDINLALKYAARIVFMKQGSVVAEIARGENLPATLLQEVFDVNANVFPLPGSEGFFVSF